jgi:hypothetical protein
MKIYIYLIALFALFSISCEKSINGFNIKEIGQNKSIIGTWQWLSSTYYYTQSGQPFIETPQSEGYTSTYTFFENDTIYIFRNDTLDLATTYKIDVITYNNGTVRIVCYSSTILHRPLLR